MPFSDMGGHFFEAEIASLEASGITSGCSTTSFCPDRSVTRAEMAAFLIRALA
jgi:chondroitin AC lyase